MNEILKILLEELNESPIILTEHIKQKIYKLIPVPNDYEIYWAHITKFGGNPNGIVFTDKALIIKSNKKVNKIPIYQIIEWENFNIVDYNFEIKNGKNKKQYFFKQNNEIIITFDDKKLYKTLNMFRKKVIKENDFYNEILRANSSSALNSINVESTYFNAIYGKSNTITGHGVYAEEVGSLLDKLNGESSTVVGRDNAKNGPDKIVNSIPIQCKYYKSANASVNACFKKNNGKEIFRYYDLSGNPMKIEVPSDQYNNAISIMKEKILSGNVPGVKDPNQAYEIIRKGKLKYIQAQNLAKSGTIESIQYDAVTSAVNCLSVLGMSTLVTFAQVYWTTKDYKKATKTALYIGLQVYGVSFVSGIVASQVARTGLYSVLNPVGRQLTMSLSPNTIQTVINSFRYLSGKKAIYGAAAQKSFVKFMGSTVITQCVMLACFAVPDTYRTISGKMSLSQYTKNLLASVSSVSGAIVSSTATGAYLGKKFGDNLDNTSIKFIGFGAGAIGGFVTGAVVKVGAGKLREDDMSIMLRMFNSVVTNQILDYMLNTDEINRLIDIFNDDEKNIKKLCQNLVSSKNQEKDIKDYLKPHIQNILRERHNIGLDDENEFIDELEMLGVEGELIYEM